MAWRQLLHQTGRARTCGALLWVAGWSLSASLAAQPKPDAPARAHASSSRRAPADAAAQPRAAEIPAHNRADQSVPPPRPPAAEVDAKIRALFEAIVADDPSLAADAFFPRAAFLLVKAMAKPQNYYDKLRKRFDVDIHTLHRELPGIAHAEFDHFELAQRGGFVAPNEEGNRLPYWASRHSRLHYRVGQVVQSFEVRVLITWDDHWYVIHLSEFH